MKSLHLPRATALRSAAVAALAAALFALIPTPASAQANPPPEARPALTIPAAAQAGPGFNVDAATNAYLAEVPPAARARSDAYFEGGYWLILWDFLAGAAISLLLLQLGWSAAMRDFAERVTRFKPVQSLIYWAEYLTVASALGFPLTIYESFVREHHYGMATQTFGPWAFDQVKQLLVGIILGGLVVTVVMGVIRRLPRTWWFWGAVVTLGFYAFVVMIAPVYLTPLFNKVTRLEEPGITGPILAMARANGIPANDVYVIDASRQTTRISANVSGLGRTLRVTLNDNLLRRCAPESILAVMGHEMAHYVLGHIEVILGFYLIVVVAGFSWLRWSLDWCLRRWGGRWRVRGVGDIAVVPLFMLLFSCFFFVLTPITNTFSRTLETQADIFGLDAARQPDGFARVALQLAEYRKLSPGPLEEWLFYDHPSGRARIHAAMRWKAENLSLFAPPEPPAQVSPPPATGS